jgi:CheY-like chemotaxis protein
LNPEVLLKIDNSCECKKVLIVYDNNFNVYSLRSVLNYQFNLDADVAYNGKQAVEMVQNRMEANCQVCKEPFYRVILMDVEMPITNGYEATTIIREIELNYCL